MQMRQLSMYKISLNNEAITDMAYFAEKEPKVLAKIAKLFESISKTPFKGIGKPEPLKHNLKGYWSRRITDEHRLVYTVEKDNVIITQCRLH